MSGSEVWLPKEHGAYGQVAFPLATAFGVAGVSTDGLLLSATVIAGFLAHEPAAIVLGLRGSRAKRELGASAIVWLCCCLATGIAAVLPPSSVLIRVTLQPSASTFFCSTSRGCQLAIGTLHRGLAKADPVPSALKANAAARTMGFIFVSRRNCVDSNEGHRSDRSLNSMRIRVQDTVSFRQ